MPPPRLSLGAFLASARKALASPPPGPRGKPLMFVVGNESADLDSLCSAVLLAYFRSHAPPHYALHIPLANLAREDLDLRPELAAALKYASTDSENGVTPADLPTLSDLPPGLDTGGARFLLVDHNAPTGELARRFGGAAAVVGCVDHHADEGLAFGGGGEQPPLRVIRKCGSCMSLVVEQCRGVWEELARAEPDAACDRALAGLALAPILVDTTNLTSESKTTETDVQAVEFAERIMAGALTASSDGSSNIQSKSADGYDRKAYFDEITRLKEDISRFGYGDVLRKDYKQWADGGLTLGVSCVVRGFDYLLAHTGNRDELLRAVKRFAEERKLDIAAVMTVDHGGGRFRRELLLWAVNERAVPAAQAFADGHAEELGLESWGDGRLDYVAESGSNPGPSQWRRCWRQNRLDCSRKQVAPILRKVMAEASKG